MAPEAGRTLSAPALESVAASDAQLINIFDAARNMLESPSRARPAGSSLPYREFLDALGVAVYTTDAAGLITFYNEAAATFWGRRPEVGEEWCGSLRLLFPDGRPMAHDECPMAIALKENRPTHGGEAWAERPDGSRVAFIAYPTPLRDAEGALMGAVNVLVDVTERRRAEQALLDTTRDLRSSNAVKDEFLGLVSHELRTPVTTIFGNAQILRDRGDSLGPEDRQSMIADVAEDSGRLLGIIENLLILTRLGSGSLPEREPQVMDRVVRNSAAAFVRRRGGRDVKLVASTGQLIVEAERTYLELVIDNLLSNADKYSPPESPIEVSIEGDPSEARVLVRDRGIGIARDEAESLFVPFYRAEPAKLQANGIGVGLAVCRRVIESHGGRIWAEPRPGGGAVFGFALPLAHDLETPVGNAR
jgi:PAS domain S-box-containing protein